MYLADKLTLIHHFAKLGGYRPCQSIDIFLIFHLTSPGHVIKGSCYMMDGKPPCYVTIVSGLTASSLIYNF